MVIMTRECSAQLAEINQGWWHYSACKLHPEDAAFRLRNLTYVIILIIGLSG